VIESPNVSRSHARVRYIDGDFEILDLNSTGGVAVNGEKVKSSKLNQGDVITLANVHLVFGEEGEFPAAQSTTRYEYPEKGKDTRQNTTTVIRTGKLKTI